MNTFRRVRQAYRDVEATLFPGSSHPLRPSTVEKEWGAILDRLWDSDGRAAVHVLWKTVDERLMTRPESVPYPGMR
jgi:hypothetical protein